MTIEVISFSTAAGFFLALSVFLLVTSRSLPQKNMLMVATFSSSLWAGMVAYQASFGSFLGTTQALGLFRSFAWFAFLLPLLNSIYHTTEKVSARYRRAFCGIAAFTLGLMLLTFYRISGGLVFEFIAGNDVLAGHLLISIGGLVIVEQLYRNASSEQKKSLKYLCLAIGGMFSYDFYLYSDALLFQRINAGLWDARGFIHALLAVIMSVAIIRNNKWAQSSKMSRISMSRRTIFHTTTLLGTGLYLVAMGIGGFYIKEYGGEWGITIQATFLFAATTILLVLIFSEQLRGRLRVFISKHFFRYKYDYREEWLYFIHMLTSTDEISSLHDRVIRAMAQIMKCNGGLLWMRRSINNLEENNKEDIFECKANWNMNNVNEIASENSSLIQFLEVQRWVVDLDEYEREPDLYKNLARLDIPAWLKNVPNAWLVAPLTLHDKLLGFVVLAKSGENYNRHFNWEDCDILKTAGKQAASHLAQQEASKALVDARKFEEMNRMSAYVIHDIKNLIAQLSLIVTNASKHRQNPLFMDDAIATVENSVKKMNRLLENLRGDVREKTTDLLDLKEVARNLIKERTQAGKTPIPVLEVKEPGSINIVADRARLSAIIGHIVQNAQDATPDDGSIIVRLYKNNLRAVLEVEDTGCGMDEAFIRARLFRPFETTKGKSGMGIGVFEVREFVHSIGGDINVESEMGKGTIFRVYLPLSSAADVVNINKSSA